MADIFLSYTRADTARAGQVARELESRGFAVFWDPEVLPGQQWRDVIHGELENAACVIVVWSAESTRSRWVMEEASEALEDGKLVPVLLDGSLPPFGFRGVEAANLSGWTPGSPDPEFENLVSAVRGKLDEAASAAAGEVADVAVAAVEGGPGDGAAEERGEVVSLPDQSFDAASPTLEASPVDVPPFRSGAAVDTPRVHEAAEAAGSGQEAADRSVGDSGVAPATDDVAPAAVLRPGDEALPPEDEEPPPASVAEPEAPAAHPAPPASVRDSPVLPPPVRRTAPDRAGTPPVRTGIAGRLGNVGLAAVGVAAVLVVILVASLGGGGGGTTGTTVDGTTTPGGSTATTGDGATQGTVVESDAVVAFRAEPAPVIDGDLDDWASVPESFRLRQEVFRDLGVETRLGEDSPGIVAAVYDDAALYLAVESGDDVYSQQNTGNQIWRGDALDINLSTASADAVSQQPDGDDFQLTMTPRDATGETASVWFTGNGSGFFDNTTDLPVQLAGRVNDDGSWQLEAAIPWSVFGLNGPPPDDISALIAVFDNDGEVVEGLPRQTVILGHTEAQFQRPLTWGTLTFER